MGELINGSKIDLRKEFHPKIGEVKTCRRNFDGLYSVKIGSKYKIKNTFGSYGLCKSIVIDVETELEYSIASQCFDRCG